MVNFPKDVPEISPALSRMAWGLSWMPWFLRRWVLISTSKPANRPPDVLDVLGTDPYCIDEIAPDKVWRVAYQFADVWITERKRVKPIDFTSEECSDSILQEAAKESSEAIEQAKEDLSKLKAINNLSTEELESGAFVKDATKILNMFVVKLNSGDLMLYCPVHIHKNSNLFNFLSELGPVKWVIIGSSYHTLFLPSVLKLFPEALVVGATGAELKLNAVSALSRGKLDYNVTKPDDFNHVKDELSAEGLDILFLSGDAVCQAVLIRAHKILLEVDTLYYSHHPDCACDACVHPISTIGRWNRRLLIRAYHSSFISHPEFGLPYYRLNMMNPNGAARYFLITPPRVGVDSCAVMADSLRGVLHADAERVCGVHRPAILSMNDYRKSIDRSWCWLDGRSLINN